MPDTPVYISNLTEDVPGYVAAPVIALNYPWRHYIGGHLGRLGTRDDVTLHQQYMADIDASVRATLPKIDPTAIFQKYGDNSWAAVKGLPRRLHRRRGGASNREVHGRAGRRRRFHAQTTFWVMESIRLDLGFASYVHP